MPKPSKGPRLGSGPAHEKLLLGTLAAQLFEKGKLKPVIGEVFPLSQATLAHKSMLARETMGKITLNPME